MTVRTRKSISVRRDTYDKLIELGSMTMTFNDVVTDLMKKANVHSAASALDTESDTKTDGYV